MHTVVFEHHDDAAVLQVNDRVKLVLIAMQHAEGLFGLVETQRDYLRQWLPWVDNMVKVSSMERYIESCEIRQQAGQEYGFIIMVDDAIAGRLGVYKLDHQNNSGEIGYWLAGELQRRGIVTESCRKLLSFCFETLGLHRLEIRCAIGNAKSAAIPKSLGFSFEGVMHEAEWLYDRFVDLEVYALLRHDYLWKQNMQ